MCSKGVHKSVNMNGNLCDNISRTPRETNISGSYKFQLLQLTKSYKICRLNIKGLCGIAYKIGISECWGRRNATGFLELSENERRNSGRAFKTLGVLLHSYHQDFGPNSYSNEICWHRPYEVQNKGVVSK